MFLAFFFEKQKKTTAIPEEREKKTFTNLRDGSFFVFFFEIGTLCVTLPPGHDL